MIPASLQRTAHRPSSVSKLTNEVVSGVHQAPGPGRDVDGCRSSLWVAADCGSRSMTQRTASTMIVGSLICGEVTRTGRVELPTFEREGHQRLLVLGPQVGRLFGNLAARRWSGRVTRPAAPRETAGPARSDDSCDRPSASRRTRDPAAADCLYEARSLWHGPSPAGARPSPGLRVRRLDQHHATHVIRQPPGEQLHDTARRGNARAGGKAGEPRSRSAGRAGCRR